MNSRDGCTGNMEKPLQGSVLCCTSIPPEQRAHMAEAAIQMGAQHKLDLTSDVTHLIVGDSNTPKYQYVAREREDVKVVRLDWVEALRQAWMRGDDVDLEALEEEYRLPTFARLRICLTGFEDLTFRAQLQEAICAHGGEYRGDLTKDVTHLIAHAPEGTKYHFATQWRIKVVSVKWLNESTDRRMILDESLFHPTLPSHKQGLGAWKRQAGAGNVRPKRACNEDAVPEPARKLRRTASAKLGSQSERIWGEIVNGPQGEGHVEKNQLPPPKSLPVSRPTVLEPKSFVTDTTLVDDDAKTSFKVDPPNGGQQSRGRGIFSGYGFFIHAFTSQQISILREHILSNDGNVLGTVANHPTAPDTRRLFVIVPYSLPSSDLPSVRQLDPPADFVTDLWLERCLHSRQFQRPDLHVLNQPLPLFPIPDFDKLIINSTGFSSIDLHHISKAVPLMGALYDEILKPSTTVLLCNPSKPGADKLLHARRWRISVISVDWLWSCARSGKLQPFGPFLLDQDQSSKAGSSNPDLVVSAGHRKGQEQLTRNGQQPTLVRPAKNAARNAGHTDAPDRQSSPTSPRAAAIKGNDNSKSPQRGKDGVRLPRSKRRNTKNTSPHLSTAPAADTNESAQQPDHDGGDDGDGDSALGLPMRDVSSNFPTEADRAPSTREGRLVHHREESSLLPGPEEDEESPSAPLATSTAKTTYVAPRAESINGAIQELLGKSRAKNTTSAMPNGGNRKKRLLGRAVSNMSRSSREGSSVRASRASSIDSGNTDGKGSGFLDEAFSNRTGSLLADRTSGREGKHHAASLELGDAALYREEYPQEGEEPPQMTQLGYENPDDAVALREVLAERRRNRTRAGQDDDARSVRPKEEKRIKDEGEAAKTGTGLNGGRRSTRQSARLP